jgi:hypothetical protein
MPAFKQNKGRFFQSQTASEQSINKRCDGAAFRKDDECADQSQDKEDRKQPVPLSYFQEFQEFTDNRLSHLNL